MYACTYMYVDIYYFDSQIDRYRYGYVCVRARAGRCVGGRIPPPQNAPSPLSESVKERADVSECAGKRTDWSSTS